jgi:3-hydroxyisobutyrate dehydrogenase-like beta-hydroxyacid dehydrogenase
MSEKERVGFIGVGLMGHGMARNIMEKGGHQLTVLAHRNREPVEDLLARGAREAGDAAAVAEASDVVFTCLPSTVEMEATFRGERGLIAGARPGMVFVDATTNDPAVTRRVGTALTAAGCALVDAALGRTPKEAEEGRASSYVGGDPHAVERARPLIACYADTIVVCGPLGAGTTCKLINNSVSMGMVALIAEAFATAAKLGVDLAALSAVLSAGGVNSGMWQAMKPWIIDGDESRLRAAVKTAAKDVRTYARMAEDAGVATIIAQAVGQTLRIAMNLGHADAFLPVLPGVLAELNGARIRDR